MSPNRPVSNDAIWERLGSLQAQTDAILREAIDAREGRKELHIKTEELSRRIGAVEDLAAEATDTLKEIKPTVDEFRHLRAKAGGVVVVLVFIGSVLTAIASLFLDQIKALIGFR